MMNRHLVSLASAACLAASAHSGAAAQADVAEPVVVEGRCNYSDRLAPLIEQGHVFVECDRLEMRQVGRQMEITFAFPARLRAIEFRGGFEDQSWFEVSAIRLRSQREWEDAEGQCEFGQPDRNDRTVTCVVRAGPRFFVVNFAPAR